MGTFVRLCGKVLGNCSAKVEAAQSTIYRLDNHPADSAGPVDPVAVSQYMFGLAGACNPYQQLFQSRQSRKSRQSSSSSSSLSASAGARPVKRPRYRVDTDSLFKQLQQRGLKLHCATCDAPVEVEHGAPLKCPTCNAAHLDLMPTLTRKIVSAR